jgi:hypothetical protein
MTENNHELEEDSQKGFAVEAKILQLIISEMQKISSDSREKLLKTIATFFNVGITDYEQNRITQSTPISSRISQFITSFSEDRTMSPKEFMLQKNPITDAERVVCLAYYLTHYRNQPEFKTLDISKLNTEAAQIKFSNPTVAVDNATNQSYFLIAATKGNKKISAQGELYVQALPDRDAAKEVLAKARPKRKSKKTKTNDQTI